MKNQKSVQHERAWKSLHARKASRVVWFSRAFAFRSLYYPWGKIGTSRSLKRVWWCLFFYFSNCSLCKVNCSALAFDVRLQITTIPITQRASAIHRKTEPEVMYWIGPWEARTLAWSVIMTLFSLSVDPTGRRTDRCATPFIVGIWKSRMLKRDLVRPWLVKIIFTFNHNVLRDENEHH